MEKGNKLKKVICYFSLLLVITLGLVSIIGTGGGSSGGDGGGSSPSPGAEWSVLSSGDAHTVALKTDDTLWTWGDNLSGQLGDGTTTDRHSPVQTGTDTDWANISAGW
ncbi:MAG: hypothetical protein GY797_39455 [Deltaproteobacteria bacterium]|nr:hypothetical protein [Deltaproteobacteria bacterium]